MNFINKLVELSKIRVTKHGAQYKAFAIFGVINYPLAYLYEMVFKDELNLNTDYSWTRVVLTFLCIIILFKDKLPTKYSKFFPLFYYISVTLAIPTFGWIMVLKNNLSFKWLINFDTGIIILVLILDSIAFIVIEMIGMILGVSFFYLFNNSLSIESSNTEIQIFLYVFLCITVLGTLFSKNKEKFHDDIKRLKDELNSNLEQQVQERTAELEHALVVRTDFLNNMSHEIRTPVQGIVNISQGLVDGWSGYTDEQRLFFSSKVAEYSQRLVSLVTNLLDLSKFSAGKVKLKLKDDDLSILTQEMVKECRDLYLKGKEIEFKFDFSLSTAPFKGDPDKITQALRNLLSNAIKFTPKGIITITLRKTTLLSEDEKYNDSINAYKLTISDEGLGIPSGEEQSIFDPFIQSSRTKTKAGGTGLGLAISKKIIEAHSGKIYAYNNNSIINENDDESKLEIENYIEKYTKSKVSSELVEAMPKLQGASFCFILPFNFTERSFDPDIIDDEEDLFDF